MKVVVTGATSFLGRAVLEQLLKAGHQVAAVVRPASPNRNKLSDYRGLAVYEMDMGGILALPGLVRAADVFLHMAWDGIGSEGRKDPLIQQKNIEASLCALRAAAALGCARFVFCGSQAEYGSGKVSSGPFWQREDGVCRPVSEYGKAKLVFGQQAGALCRSLGMEYIHTRIFSVYGPGDHPWSLVNACLSAWSRGETIALGECLQKWNYLYRDDAARGLMALAAAGDSGIYNLAGEDTRVLRSFIEQMHRECRGQGGYEYGKRPPNAEGTVSLVPSIEKIKKQTGWKPLVSFSEGIHETLSCMQRGIV